MVGLNKSRMAKLQAIIDAGGEKIIYGAGMLERYERLPPELIEIRREGNRFVVKITEQGKLELADAKAAAKPLVRATRTRDELGQRIELGILANAGTRAKILLDEYRYEVPNYNQLEVWRLVNRLVVTLGGESAAEPIPGSKKQGEEKQVLKEINPDWKNVEYLSGLRDRFKFTIEHPNNHSLSQRDLVVTILKACTTTAPTGKALFIWQAFDDYIVSLGGARIDPPVVSRRKKKDE